MSPIQGPFRRRGVFSFLGGSFIGNTGTEISGIALPLVAITLLEASNAWVATIEAVAAIVMLVVALPIGLLVDRTNRRRLLVGTYLVGAVFASLIPFLWITGHLTIAWVLLVAVGLQVFDSLADVTTDTVVPALVPDAEMDKVNGAYASSRSVAEVGGAGIGGGLISVFGLFAGLISNTVAFIVSAILMLRLPKETLDPTTSKLLQTAPRIRPSRSKRIAHGLSEFLGGFSVYRANRRLGLILVSSVTSNVFSTMAGAVEFLFLVRVLEVPAWGVGVVVSFTAVGGIVGGVINAPLVRIFGPVRIMVITQLVINLPILLLPFAFPGIGLSFYIAGWFFYAMSSVVYASAVITYRQRVVPTNLLGRVGATSRWINSLAVGGSAALTAVALTTIEIWPVVLASSVGIYVSGFWLLNRHFLRPDEVATRGDGGTNRTEALE
ncbi:MFS transporter [Brevibacterium linens]|uniref:MFS transporter n=1 Tax=Brevibacterium linens TaxID=1703 RepID=UPI0013DEA73C|nr:MFS transporter [Brevibacterium linens]